MPWEISIINGSIANPKPLGTREVVIAVFADALPGVFFKRPPVPPKEILDQMPPFVREAMLRSRLEAEFEADEFSIQFYANDQPVLDWVNGEVRGNGDPIPALAAICVKQGWSVVDASDKSVVDLSSRTGASVWERFRNWRDKAINDIGEGASAGE